MIRYIQEIRKSTPFLKKNPEKTSDLKLSAPGDRGQNIEEVNRKFNDDLDRQQKKATDELFLFRDLPRGSRLDNTSVTAVRQLLENNIAAFPEKIKKGFVKFFESLVSFKPPKGMGTITAENFVTVDVDTPHDSVLTTESIASRGQLPDRFGNKIHSGNQNVTPASAKTSKNSELKLSLLLDGGSVLTHCAFKRDFKDL